KGMVVSQEQSDVYNYEFKIRSTDVPDDGSYIGRTGRINFGSDYTVEEGNYYYLDVQRIDGAEMTATDITNVSSLFNPIYMDYGNLIKPTANGVTPKYELGGYYV